eukprot:3021206-Rhodomonas_salina.4
MDRDLHPWGCYMVAKLQKEHQLVQVDLTHADQGLEGVFLGWHDTTPSAWMYSVRLERVMLVQDEVLDHNGDYPFLDPTCIVTPGTLTADQINEMHATDLKWGETLGDDENTLASVASTQPAQHVSEDWGATKVGSFRDEVSEILENLQKQLRAVTADPNTQQLWKRVQDLELSNGTDLGTITSRTRRAERLAASLLSGTPQRRDQTTSRLVPA